MANIGIPPYEGFDVKKFQEFLKTLGVDVEITGELDEKTTPFLNQTNLDQFKVYVSATPNKISETVIDNTGFTPKPLAEIGTDTPVINEVIGAVDKAKREGKSGGTLKKDILSKLGGVANKRDANKLAMAMSSAKALKTSGIANIAGNAGQGILGLAQLIKGKNTAKNLKEPKYPEQLPNELLNTRLAEAQRQAQMPNPQLLEQQTRDMATQRFLQDQKAKVVSGGNLGIYGSLAQQAGTQNLNAIRENYAQQNSDLLQRQGVADNLLLQKSEDDRQRYLDRLGKYTSVDLPEYQANRQYGATLTQNALGNIFGGYGGFAKNMPVATTAGSLNQVMLQQFSAMTPEQQEMVAAYNPQLKSLISKKRAIPRFISG